MHLKKEKQIQKEIQNRLSLSGYKYNILDEEYKNLKLNENHKYLLLEKYSANGVDYFQGLRFYLEKFNKHLFEEFSKNYTKNELIDIFLKDFISRWDSAKNNADYYNLIFNAGFLSVNLKDNNNKKVNKSYNVISFNRPADNEYTIIKEKRLEGKNGVERPDFAMYINGIPLIAWEVKTKQTTIKSAFKEYTIKDTYSKFILCLGTDGEDVFLTGSKTMYFMWKKYGKHIADNYVFEIEDFLLQKEHTVNEISYIQKLFENNIDKNKREQFLDLIKPYSMEVDFDNLSNVLVKIIKNKPTQKQTLIEVIKNYLIQKTSGLEDIISELIDSPKNLMFYFKYGIMVDKVDLNNEENSETFIINHKVQQYYTTKALNKKLNNLINQNKKGSLMAELVKHVQRSGKSITARSCVNLIEDNFQELYKKIYVCVPDLTILKVMRKTFLNNEVKIKIIKNRADLIRSIGGKNTTFTVYLYNIQKTQDPESFEIEGDDFKNIQKRYLSNDVLFMIDEVHYSQGKTQAAIRDYCFPNASFLTFTATPKINERNGKLINETAIRYGEANGKGEFNFLDELNEADAIPMGIILPVVYEKAKFQQTANLQHAKELDDKIEELFKNYLNNNEISLKIQAEKEESEEKIRSELEPFIGSGLTEDIINRQIKQSNESIDDKYLEKGLKEIEKEVKINALNQLREYKIEFVINDMENKRNNFYSNIQNKTPTFRMKAFFVVKEQKDAQRYIEAVKKLSSNSDNVYRGYRFGVDFSETQQSVSGISLLPELNGFSEDVEIIKKFEEQNENKDPVDILFIVDKYLMGYDNKELAVVYCDKIIKEPAKLYQLITRPATTREGKEQGFFVDLTFGDENYRTYTEKCLPYYNNNSKISIFTLTKEEILIQKERLKKKINDIKTLLGYKESDLLLDEFEIYNKLLSKGEKNKSESDIINRKNSYFNHFKEMNEIMKILIKPQYYMENFEEILTLSKVNTRYLEENCPKPEEIIIFDKDKIKEIITQSLQFFGFENLEEINEFQINNSEVMDTKLSARIEFNNVITQFKQRIKMARVEKPKGFSDIVEKWTEQIMSNQDAEIKINEFKEQFEKPFEKEQEKKKELIKNDFNNSLSWYIAFQALRKGYALIEEFNSTNSYTGKIKDIKSLNNLGNEKIFDDFLKEYAQVVSSKINNILNEESLNIENIEFYIDKVINNYEIDLKSLNQLKCFDNIEEKEVKNIKKIFWNDSKKIKNIIEQGRSVSEYMQSEVVNKDVNTKSIWILFMLEDYYVELNNKSLGE